jgi:quercetin dioxygenase-like cupin family protein
MVREGELLHVPAGAPHQAEALDDTFVLDVTVEPAGTAGSPGPGEEAP